jgi:hypothetical protein
VKAPSKIWSMMVRRSIANEIALRTSGSETSGSVSLKPMYVKLLDSRRALRPGSSRLYRYAASKSWKILKAIRSSLPGHSPE